MTADAQSLCPDEDAIDRFTSGSLDAPMQLTIEQHIDDCDDCRVLVATLTESSGRVAPNRIGRFEVRDLLGMGAMGAVYRAFDPDLKREVALKLVFGSGNRGEAPTREEAKAHSLHEAQAMARLSHPNVVPVYDVGVFHGEVFIAMELVVGTTLDGWLASEDRRQEQIVDAFVQAGRGLAAAHKAGIVHRDFKPANVLMSNEGKVLVSDFGLAGPVDHQTQRVVQGTPLYMAPEQHRGETLCARADQYSFALALVEALDGTRPFPHAKTERQLEVAKQAGLAASTLPRWLAKVVGRATHANKSERFPDMDALLAALDRRKVQRRRALVGMALLGSVALAVAATSGAWLASNSKATPCAAPRKAIEPIWGERQRAALSERMHASGRTHVVTSLASVERGLDAYRADWLEEIAQVCTANEAISPPRVAETHACLGRRLEELNRVVQGLVSASEVGVVDRAVDIVSRLPPVETCGATQAQPPKDHATAQLVSTLQHDLAKARADYVLGNYESAHAEATRIGEEALPLAYPPLQIDADLLSGRLNRLLANFDESETRLLRASKNAALIGDDQAIAEAFMGLVQTYISKGDLDSANTTMALADTAISRAGNSPRMRQRYFDCEMQLSFQRGKFDQAAEYAKQVMELDNEIHGVTSADTLVSLAAIATVQGASGAEELLRSALELITSLKGSDHPDSIAPSLSLCVVLQREGENTKAQAFCEQALRVSKQTAGDAHPNVGRSLLGLCSISRTTGELDKAAKLCRQGLSVFEQALGSEHINVAAAAQQLADVLRRQGAYPEALQYQEQTLRVSHALLGDNHLMYRSAQSDYGLLLNLSGTYAEAVVALEAALATPVLSGSALVKAHERLATALSGLGQYEAAEPHIRTAIATHAQSDDVRHAELLNSLAVSLIGLGRQQEARKELDASLAIQEAQGSADSPEFGFALNNVGEILSRDGDLHGALSYYQRAERWFGSASRNSNRGVPLVNIGDVHARLGKTDKAHSAFAEALALWDATLPADHVFVAYALTGIGEAKVAKREFRDALVPLERALDIRTKHAVTDVEMGKTLFALGQALWETGDAPARAQTLVQTAGTIFEKHGDAGRQKRVTRWRKRHKR